MSNKVVFRTYARITCYSLGFRDSTWGRESFTYKLLFIFTGSGRRRRVWYYGQP